MRRATECRTHARECRKLAKLSPPGSIQHKQLLTMAEGWDNFAIERERMEARAIAARNPIGKGNAHD